MKVRVIISMMVLSYASEIVENDRRRSDLAMTKIGYPSIITYNIICISYNQYTDIYPQTSFNVYNFIVFRLEKDRSSRKI